MGYWLKHSDFNKLDRTYRTERDPEKEVVVVGRKQAAAFLINDITPYSWKELVEFVSVAAKKLGLRPDECQIDFETYDYGFVTEVTDASDVRTVALVQKLQKHTA